MAVETDVAILGGGLAGLSLALQLRRQDPALRITVIERQRHPVREAAFKVGESSVEIGAHYFSEVLGLREHLDGEQIRKFGFRFFFSEGEHELARSTELGVSRLLPMPSWQIDRGRFENFLGGHVRAQGVDFLDGAVVRGVDLGEGNAPHGVRFERDGVANELACRWIVDASGRAGLLKRKLGLSEPNDHAAGAVWWRVDGHLDPNGWVDDPAWHARCTPPDRWRSTNHLCGPGCWVWLIPLSSGAHSIGIVFDGETHALESLNTHDKAMAWLREHQPRLAQALDDPRHAVQDFMFLRRFSYGCRDVFSADRWALTGEAGLFLDPFYSPGSDFIALANTYICDLVARDRAGGRLPPYAAVWQELYRSFYENTLTLYRGQYPLFGDAQVMPLKVIWDYTFYWALLAPLYCGGYATDLGVLGRLRAEFATASALNIAVQALLRDWGACNRREGATVPDGRLLDQARIPWFHELNRQLADVLEPAAFAERARRDIERMRTLAAELLANARVQYPDIAAHGLDALTRDVEAGDAPLLAAHWYAVEAVVTA